jgi:predicted MPP superfamily phosphohydrolase
MFAIASFVLAFGPPWVLYLWILGSFPAAARHRGTVLAALGAFIVVQPLTYVLVVRAHWAPVYGVHFVLMLIAITIAMATPGLALLVATSWAFGARARKRGGGAPEALNSVHRRQIVEATVGTVLFGVTGGALGWGILRGRHDYRLVEVPIRIPGLPRALDGYVIAQISDIHTGEYVGEREFGEGLTLVHRARPDLIVVTGDIVDFDASYTPLAARRIADLPARDGVFACLGNHDHYAGAGAVAAALRAAGIEPLVNAGRVIRPGDGGGFALLGVDDLASLRRGGRGPDLRLALAGVPSALPRILLSHQPPTVDGWAGQVALQLSGHTHGGQINPGGVVTSPLFEYVAGLYAVRGTSLYVNRGFGTVGPPARIGVPPEVTRIVLVAA